MTLSKPSIVIEVRELTKKYGTKGGIHGVSAAFQNDRIHLLVGTNGSGKSTLLKCIMGLLNYEGAIEKKHFRIGYAPEEYVMPCYMSVRDFLISIGRIREHERDRVESEIEQQLVFFDLKNHESKPIGKLSNGMRQKVNLIQAFLNHPKILLLDEPLRSLDSESQLKTLSLIRERMNESLIIVSTHSPEKFHFRNKRVWKMESGALSEEPHA